MVLNKSIQLLTVFLTFSITLSANAAPIKIGVIAPLTGDTAAWGESGRNGAELALARLPKDIKKQITIIYEDDQQEPSAAVTAFKKLTEQDGVTAVISFASNTSKAIAPLADQKKVPVIAIASDAEVVKGRSYVVNLWVTPEEEMKVLVPELSRRGFKNIARISATHVFNLALRDTLDMANQGNFSLLIDEEYPVETKDFRPFLIKVKNLKKVEAIYVNLFFGQTGLFAKQARQLGVKLPLIGVETFEDPNDVKLSEGALFGQWYIQADDASSDFVKLYQEKFPGKSIYAAANIYDSVNLIALAIKNGTGTTEGINNAIHSVKDFSGALGHYSSTEDNKFTLPATVKVVTKNGFEKLEDLKS